MPMKILFLHGIINANNYAATCRAQGLDEKEVVFLFPGSTAHDVSVGSAPYTKKISGGGLAGSIAPMGDAFIPTLSLPTTDNRLGDVVGKKMSQARAKKAAADLWRLVGRSFEADVTIAIPVRDEGGPRATVAKLPFVPPLSYLADSTSGAAPVSAGETKAVVSDKKYQASFGGGIAADNLDALVYSHYYLDHINLILDAQKSGKSKDEIEALLASDPELLRAFQEGVKGEPSEWFAKKFTGTPAPLPSASPLTAMASVVPTTASSFTLPAFHSPAEFKVTPVASSSSSSTTTTTTRSVPKAPSRGLFGRLGSTASGGGGGGGGYFGAYADEDFGSAPPPRYRASADTPISFITAFRDEEKAPNFKVNFNFLTGDINPASYANFYQSQSPKLNPSDFVLISGGMLTETQNFGLYTPKLGGIAEKFNKSGIPTLILPTAGLMSDAEATYAIGDLWYVLGNMIRNKKTPSFTFPMKEGEIDLGPVTAENRDYQLYYKAQLKFFIKVCQEFTPVSFHSIQNHLNDNPFFLRMFLDGFFNTQIKKHMVESDITSNALASSPKVPDKETTVDAKAMESKTSTLESMVFNTATSSSSESKFSEDKPAPYPSLISDQLLPVLPDLFSETTSTTAAESSTTDRLIAQAKKRRGYTDTRVDNALYIVAPRAATREIKETSIGKETLEKIISHILQVNSEQEKAKLEEIKSWLRGLILISRKEPQFLKYSFRAGAAEEVHTSDSVDEMLKAKNLRSLLTIAGEGTKTTSTRAPSQVAFFKQILITLAKGNSLSSIQTPVGIRNEKMKQQETAPGSTSSTSTRRPIS